MSASFSAIIQQSGGCSIGWVLEVPGVNTQAPTREELLVNLLDALDEAIEMNCAQARAAATGMYEEVILAPWSGTT